MSNYIMDNRSFKLLPETEYKEIVIMEKKGEVFYVSRELKENNIIFLKTVTDQSMWFYESEFPDLFNSFDLLYKELGNIDYRLYGFRETEGEKNIKFFDLKIIKSTIDQEWFYHDDFAMLCEKFNLPICTIHARGEFSLKTIKKLLSKIELEEGNLLFKPTCEHTFGIVNVIGEAQNVLPFRSRKKERKNNKTTNATEETVNKQEFFDFMSSIIDPLLITDEGIISPPSLEDYANYFCSIKFDSAYEKILQEKGIKINYNTYSSMSEALADYISDSIIEAASVYLEFMSGGIIAKNALASIEVKERIINKIEPKMDAICKRIYYKQFDRLY